MKLFNGKEYLQIDIANNYGKDKLTYTERLDWFNKELASKLSKDITNDEIYELVKDEEEKELLFVGIKAYRDYLNNLSIKHMVGFDATTSGMQIMSALTGDRNAMRLTNLIEPDKRIDAYTEIFNYLKSKYPEETKENNLVRQDIKKAIMILLYGGNKSVVRHLKGNEKLYEILLEVCDELIPEVMKLNRDLMDTIVKGEPEYNWIAPDNFHIKTQMKVMKYEKIRLADGTWIDIKYKDVGFEPKSKCNGANFVHSIDSFIARELIGRCNYNPSSLRNVETLIKLIEMFNEPDKKLTIKSLDHNLILKELYQIYRETKFLSYRFIEYIYSPDELQYLFQDTNFKEDLLNLVQTLRKYQPFEVICIHDNFWSHPNNMNYVRYWYKEIMAELLEKRLLKFMLKQMPKGKELYDEHFKPYLEPYNKNEIKELVSLIRNSNYAIC